MSNSTELALTIGDSTWYQAIYADGRAFVFSRSQVDFLSSLQKTKDVSLACQMANWPPEKAQRFLASRKFRLFRSAKLNESSVKNGVTLEWWHQFGKWATEGKKSWYSGTCELCRSESTFNEYDAEASRDDEMRLNLTCQFCFEPIKAELKTELFKPSREQIQVWIEFGSRLIPKVERVQHSFNKENFVFEATDD